MIINMSSLIFIHVNDEEGFMWAYEDEHKHIVKYLLSVGCYSHRYNNSTIGGKIELCSIFLQD